MKPSTTRGRAASSSVVLFLLAAALLAGCPEDAASGSDTTSGDTSRADTSAGDATGSDTLGVNDTGSADTALDDTSAEDTSAEDTSAEDTGAEDTGPVDTTEADTDPADSAEADTSTEDTVETDTTPVPTCLPDSCSGHGQCSDAGGVIACECAPGYEGAACETDTDECAGDPCQNGGICTDGVDGFTCGCTTGYAGATCGDCDTDYQDNDDDDICAPACAIAGCGANTACDDATGAAVCSCVTGYLDLLGDGTCTESTCGDGYVDVAKDEECESADFFCVDCLVDCTPLDDNNSFGTTTGCYAQLDDNVTWAAAAATCEAAGAHLVELSDTQEWETLLDNGWFQGWLNLQGSFAGGIDDAWLSGAPIEVEPVYYYGLDQNTTLPDENSTLPDPFCVSYRYNYWMASSCDDNATSVAVCELETCGDGVVNANEGCDDGGLEDGDGCDSNCTATGCGNLVVTAGEDCDDGDDDDFDECPNDCALPACALLFDSISASYEDSTGCYVMPSGTRSWESAKAACEAVGMTLPAVTSRRVADLLNAMAPTSGLWIGLTDVETDGTWLLLDGTEATFLPFEGQEPNGGATENCGELGSGGGFNDLLCTASRRYVCVDQTCGDAVPDPNEECDDGNDVEGDGCDTNCRVSGCGNGVVGGIETCDDGNTDDSDGCDADCSLQCGSTSGADEAWIYQSWCYLVFGDAPKVIDDAQAACEAVGARLADVADAAENNHVFGISGSGWLLGLSDADVEGTFVWTSGLTATYTNWAFNEPNNAGTGEDCVYYRDDGSWNDGNCAGKARYVCEFSLF